MNHILHNISMILLFFGIILMTVYFTKASNNGFETTEKKNLQNVRRRETYQSIYDYRVTDDYEKMFIQPSMWLGYQDYDPKETS